MNMKCSIHVLILILIHVRSFSPATSNPRIAESDVICSDSFHTPATTLLPNFAAATRSVADQLRKRGFGSATVQSPRPAVDAFGQCHADLSPADCNNCSAAARSRLPRCLPSLAGAVFMEGCFLRYSDGAGARTPARVKCGQSMENGVAWDGYMKAEYAKKVRAAVEILADGAAKSEVRFKVWVDRGGVEDVYMLAQCWRSVSPDGCLRCVRDAGNNVVGQCAVAAGSGEGRAMFPDCYLRYSTESFFIVPTKKNPSDTELEPTRGWIIFASSSATVLALISVSGIYFGCKKRILKKKEDRHPEISITLRNPSLNFKYEMLEKATEFFDPLRKLGQGGAGSVFKGILPDGRPVAVKRLFFNTRNWVDEFFNEVNLINGIEHNNVVKLLGCSIEGPESLLVYEFVPNRSLDQYLFDKKNAANILSWQQRYDIIIGTADGLAYLHGGSGVRIIHRDIKTSNILLSETLSPKIADFGLARSVASDKSHISTGIAGTLGYMAPEYLVRGQLTEKADVYAFGVMVLEIVCGKRNSAFTLGSGSILHNVWKLHKENKIILSVDPVLHGNFPPREASNVLQIGLLCTQASVPLRPSMAEVVKMLSDSGCEIPSPKQPPFLNASLLSSDIPMSRAFGEIPGPYSFSGNSTSMYVTACDSSGGTSSLVSTKLLPPVSKESFTSWEI